MSSAEFNDTSRLSADDLSLLKWRRNYDLRGDEAVLADAGRHQVKLYNISSEASSCVSGVPHFAGFRDGPAPAALFNAPSSALWLDWRPGGLHPKHILLFKSAACAASYDATGTLEPDCLDDTSPQADFALVRLQRLFNDTGADELSFFIVSDTLNHCVRIVDPRARQTRTLAGSCGQEGFRDGFPWNGRLSRPGWLATDELHRLYVHDAGNAKIRVIDLPGSFADVESFVLGAQMRTLEDGACINPPAGFADAVEALNSTDFRYSLCYRSWVSGPDAPNYFDFDYISSYCAKLFWDCAR